MSKTPEQRAAFNEWRRAHRKKQRAENPDKVRAEARKRYAERDLAAQSRRRLDRLRADPVTNEALKAKRRAEYAENKEYWVKNWRLRLYGLTPEQHAAMLTEQRGCCPICGDAFDPNRPRHQHIDHDHTTGTVRGILCTDCNLGLGRFKDNTSNLQGASAYLRRAATLPVLNPPDVRWT